MEKSIAQVSAMSISDCADFLGKLKLDARDKKIAERVLKEVNESAALPGRRRPRLPVAQPRGRHPLRRRGPSASAWPPRSAPASSASCTSTEPSIGLHQRDNHRLIETLVRLREMGNTLIVVEHDEDTIKVADWVVDIGPGAGEHGGKVVDTSRP